MSYGVIYLLTYNIMLIQTQFIKLLYIEIPIVQFILLLFKCNKVFFLIILIELITIILLFFLHFHFYNTSMCILNVLFSLLSEGIHSLGYNSFYLCTIITYIITAIIIQQLLLLTFIRSAVQFTITCSLNVTN